MPKKLLTPSFVKELLNSQINQKQCFFDIRCRGLMLEVRPKGATYYFRYKDLHGRVRQYRICFVGDLTLAKVRQHVDYLRGQIALGQDPAAIRDELKKVPTFKEFCEERYLPYIKMYKRSWSTDESLLRNHLYPRFGNKYLDEITKKEIIEMHHSRRVEGASANSANRLVIIVRYIFNLAIKWEVNAVINNPTKNVTLFEENNKRERYLTELEAKSLYEEIKQSENLMLRYIIPMLILTGARRGEVLRARWEDISYEQKLWRVPMSKSGKSRFVPLSESALALLDLTPKYPNCPWVFPNPRTKEPFVSIYHSWNRARNNVGMPELRIHDLRHSFASFLINSGRSLYEVQKILGHSQLVTTQRYSHLSEKTLNEASQMAAIASGILIIDK
jgi:integrase